MMEIKKEDEIDIRKIYGDKKYEKWLKEYPILENKDIRAWIINKIDQYTDEGKEASKFSITSYLKSIYQYCQFYQTENPSELLKEDIDERNRRFKKYMMFLKNAKDGDPKLKELGFRINKETGIVKSPSEESIRNNLQGRIKSFYSNRGVPITYKLKSVKSGANINELVLNRTYIKLIQARLEAVNYRLLCKFESQTGLRINDILDELTSGKYEIEKYKEHYFIRNFKTQKEMVIINYLFFTQELAELIQSATSETDLTKLDLTKLFITRHGNTISANNYLERLKIIVKELGIKGNIKTHGLRKYFTSQISKNKKKLDDDRIIIHWEGREAPYRDQVYLTHIKDIDYYYKEWKKIETDICVDCIVYDKTNVEVVKLKEKILNLEEQRDIAIKNSKELRTDLNEMGKIVEVMEKYIFYKITEEKYPDIKIDKDTNLTNLILKEYNKLIEDKE